MRNTLKISVGYIVGVFITIVAMRNEEIDWELLFTLILGGFIGILAVSSITIYIKNAKN